MKPNYRAAASAGLLLSACATTTHGATTVQTTIGPATSANNFDLLFSTPLTSVEQLVSIGSGSVNTGEGAVITISAVLANDSLVQVFSAAANPPFQTVSLSSITTNTFTPFTSPQSVKGLRFTSSGFGQPASFSFPALTVVTFTVPEPAAAIMVLMGGACLTFGRRRSIA